VSFITPLDILNRALQRCGKPRVGSFADRNPNAQEMAFIYDKVRRAELRRNTWRFATRRAALRPLDSTVLRLVPANWSATEIYVVGSIVTYQGQIYYSRVSPNLNQAPTDQYSSGWGLYFGPRYVPAWLDTVQTGTPAAAAPGGYYAGELVYNPGTNPGYTVFLSMTSANNDTPGSYPLWAATQTYMIGDTVGTLPLQLSFVPGDLPVDFSPGGLPIDWTGAAYQSTIDLNLNNAPPGPGWAALPVTNQTDVQTGNNWLQLDATLRSESTLIYPLGSGPLSQPQTRNAYPLPNNFLREAPQCPKPGTNFLGAPSEPFPDDWEYNGNFIVSSSFDPILFRFIADISNVPDMDDMFCEGVSARMAMEANPLLTDSTVKQQLLARQYKDIMGEARTVNSIEEGYVVQPEDEYLTVRY
jgi:hypothetical protein